MKKYSFLLSLLVAGILAGSAAGLHASPGPVILVPVDAKDGTLVPTAEGGQAVSLPSKTPPGKGYRWELAKPLAPGWWEVAVDFADLPQSSPRLILNFGTALAPAYDLDQFGYSPKSGPLRLRLFTATPMTKLEVRPQRTMAETILAVKNVTFTPVEGPGDGSAVVLLELPAGTARELKLPDGLPPGNWQVRLSSKAGQKPRETETVALSGAGGEIVTAPQSRYVAVYMSQPPVKMAFSTSENLEGATLLSLPKYKPGLPYTATGTPLPITVPTEFTRIPLTLTYAGNATESAPTFPLLPDNAQMAVVTSWDDSPKSQDLRNSELLEKHGYHGTFFVMMQAPNQKDYLETLEKRGMEVASHTLNHARNWTITPEQWAKECLQMRLKLEAVLKHPIISFAYPYNYATAYDAAGEYILRGVEQAGYLSGRSTNIGDETISGYASPLTLVTNGHFRNQAKTFEAAWERASAKPGGVFYFWGHSWEIGSEEQWTEYEALLTKYERRPGVWYATQGQLFLWKWLKTNAKWEGMAVKGSQATVTLVYPKLDPWLESQLSLSVALPPGVNAVTPVDQTEMIVKDGTVTLPHPQP